MISRRKFLTGAGMAGVAAAGVAASAVSRVAMAALPEPVMQTSTDTMPPRWPTAVGPTTRW